MTSWEAWAVAVVVTFMVAVALFGLFSLVPQPAFHALETLTVTPA